MSATTRLAETSRLYGHSSARVGLSRHRGPYHFHRHRSTSMVTEGAAMPGVNADVEELPPAAASTNSLDVLAPFPKPGRTPRSQFQPIYLRGDDPQRLSGGSRYLSHSTAALRVTTAPVEARNRVGPGVFSADVRAAPTRQTDLLIPAARQQYVGKLVVVLDLDETLVSCRGTVVSVRQGTDRLLRALKGHCELIVWTAGTRDYALDVIKQIDPSCAIQHCIYRHPMWWNGEPGCIKDLRMLGRPMEKIVFIDNTPDVFRANPNNSILVSDFEGTGERDTVLATISGIFEHVFHRFTNPVAADVFASRHIKKRVVPLDNGTGSLTLNTVTGDNPLQPPSANSSRLAGRWTPRNHTYSFV